MEQGKKKLSLTDLLSGTELKKSLFASLLGDGNGNYNLFRIVIDPNAPEIKQRIYTNDYRNSF